MRRTLAATILGVAGAILIAACGGTPPTTPTPGGGGGGGGGPVPPPPNNLPVIDSITIQGTRAKEPANFADLGESVPIAAKVHDDETAADQLEYQWSATVGTFTGTGASVVWMAPAASTTPVDVTITLKVVEKYGYPGAPLNFSHDVSADATLSLHDSAKEVGDMARQFLLDFSDSTIRDVPYIMRNFDLTCREAREESNQVSENRKHLKILRWNIGVPTVTVPFGNSFCPGISQADPSRSQRGDACTATRAHWESTFLDNGHFTVADGIDWINAFYRPALKAWKLCDSQFTGTCKDVTAGVGCADAVKSAITPAVSR
jgi:hypothetical protein